MYQLSKLAKLRDKSLPRSIDLYALYVHDKKVIVMTNGHYLIEISTELLNIDVSENTNSDLFIPLEAFSELEKAAKKQKYMPAVIQIDGNFIKTVAGALVQFECLTAGRRGGLWESAEGTFPNYECVLPGYYKDSAINHIGVSPSILSGVLDFFKVNKAVKFAFRSKESCIKIIPDLSEYEGAILKCIVMPCMIGDDYCKDWE